MENNKFKALRKFRVYSIPISLVLIIGTCYLASINVIKDKDLILNIGSCMISFAMLLIMAGFFVSFKDIKFTHSFVQINLEKIKYSAFSEVYIKDSMLSLHSENKQVISETTLNLFSAKQIDQIIEEFAKHNKTVINNRVSQGQEKTKFKALGKFRVYVIPISLVLIIGACYLASIQDKDLILNVVYFCMTSFGMAGFFVSFKDIKFTHSFVQINLEKIKYSAFSEVYISKNSVLSLRSDAPKVLMEITLKLFNENQIDRIIEEFEKHNKTVIDNRPQATEEKMKFYTKDIGNYLFVTAAFCIGIPFFILKEDMPIWLRIPCVLMCICFSLYFFAVILKGELYFDADDICILGNEFSWRRISLPSVSTVKIANDNNLIFYNSFNDSEYSFDLDRMRNDDAQKIINILSRKVPISIDPQIAIEKNYTLPKGAIEEENTSNRRRKVVTTAEIIPIKASNKNVQTKRNLELDTLESSTDNKTKRRLEL